MVPATMSAPVQPSWVRLDRPNLSTIATDVMEIEGGCLVHVTRLTTSAKGIGANTPVSSSLVFVPNAKLATFGLTRSDVPTEQS